MTAHRLCEQGVQLLQAGKAAEAEPLFLQALTSEPRHATALEMMGIIRFGQDRHEEALAYFDQTATLAPSFALFSNRGAALQLLHRFGEALASYDAALALQPRHAMVHFNRGRTLQDMGRFDEALGAYRASLALDPNFALAWNNCGNTLRALKRSDEAHAAYDRALGLAPNHVEALYNRGTLLWAEKGQYAGALRDLENAARIDPGHDYVLGELLYLRLHGGDWRDFDILRARIDAGVEAGRAVVQPFHYQAISSSPAHLQACSALYAKRHFPAQQPMCKPHAHAKIRLGYVAGEFREHATSHLMAGLFEHHDRAKFDVIGFDNGWDDGSALRKRLENGFDKIHDISRLSDADAAAQIAGEGIDILVNLNGYVGLHRMGVFAHRPAPIQVNYLGFPATTGAPYMDYILADRIVIPEAEEKFYTEKVITLPNSYQVNDSKRAIAGHPPSRADCGLPEKGFVFCSFNSSYKLTPAVFALWMQILTDVPDSVLWLLESNPQFAANLRRAAANAGVAAERLVFAPMIAPGENLARLGLADLFLDLLPCGAHTTASDALWAGLPLLTCRGNSFPGRVAASLLHAIGLPELITENLDDYRAAAIRLARNPSELAALRAKLAQNRFTTALFDTAQFAREIEAAYLAMTAAS